MPTSEKKIEANRKNAKLGGRKKGKLLPKTIEKQKTLEAFNKRVFEMADKLLNAQAAVALGSYKMITITIIDGIKTVETIRDDKRMQKLLDTGVLGEDYFIVVGKLPDFKAANALLDRAYGKAKETIDLSGEVKFSLTALAQERERIKMGNVDITPGIVAAQEALEAAPEK